MTALVFSPAAQSDLEDIWNYIALENEPAATRVIRHIIQRAEMLALAPRIGARRRYIRPRTRALVERPYLILYETHPNTDRGPVDTVEIVRVVDGRRDLRALFR
jgi:toxin ParE1/3/4